MTIDGGKMTESNYPEPVRQLIEIGFPEHNWTNYLAKYGITREHIPDLIRLGGRQGASIWRSEP